MATLTVTDILTRTANATVVTKTVNATTSATPSSRAPEQAGILNHGNPSVYDPKNPIFIFLIQAFIILILCRLLHWPLSMIRQPRVIAEVLGGILLGPSVMGHVPNFTNTIFPAASIPNLTLVANLGLVLFLFLVGLEVDMRFLVKHWRVALTVGALGMALPFGAGCGIAYGLYHAFRTDSGLQEIAFPTYMVFIGVAMAITAFPVLCRILTELKLLGTPVGVTVLAAGVGNDVVGWILLALCVALVNSGSGIVALYVLLTCLAWALFLVFAIRPAFMIILKRSRSLQDGPSQSIVALTLMIALTSAFFTGVVGVHPIFGAFLAGLIMPHEGGFAVKVTEKVEDLVSALFLPLYFALSGLSTNLGLLDDGKTWGYVIGVIMIAFFGKFIGGTGAARLMGLVWRESFTIGSLMSCKGLVELIVLNIGLQAKILSQRTFTIFVLMALITTFATTPLVRWLYPPWYQTKIEAWKRGEIDWASGEKLSDSDLTDDTSEVEKVQAAPIRRFLVYLRLDSLPTTLGVIGLLGGVNDHLSHPKPTSASKDSDSDYLVSDFQRSGPMTTHGLRMLPLTERDSSVMRVTESNEYTTFDPVINTFRACGALHNVPTTGETVISPENAYPLTLCSRAAQDASDFVLVPWSQTGSMSETSLPASDSDTNSAHFSTGPFTDFVREAFESTAATAHVGVLVDNNPALETTPKTRRLIVPFFGSADDRVAVRLALQFARNSNIVVEVWSIQHELQDSLTTKEANNNEKRPSLARMRSRDSTTSTRVTALTSENQRAFTSSLRASLPSSVSSRVNFDTSIDHTHARSMSEMVDQVAARLVGAASAPGSGVSDILLVGRNASASVENAPSCLGLLAERAHAHGAGVEGNTQSLLVVQARM